MANSPSGINAVYKWAGVYGKGCPRIEEKDTYKSKNYTKNQPTAADTPKRKEGQVTIDDFVAEK